VDVLRYPVSGFLVSVVDIAKALKYAKYENGYFEVQNSFGDDSSGIWKPESSNLLARTGNTIN
jgi:hypothetical protein